MVFSDIFTPSHTQPSPLTAALSPPLSTLSPSGLGPSSAPASHFVPTPLMSHPCCLLVSATDPELPKGKASD